MMEHVIRADVLTRLENDYGLKHRAGTDFMRGGVCPACGKKELYSSFVNPWFIKCGRESKCGQQWHVKELYDDIFDDWSNRAPATDDQPTATARAYLEFARGFKMDLVAGLFTQESYFDRDLEIGSASLPTSIRPPFRRPFFSISAAAEFGTPSTGTKPANSGAAMWRLQTCLWQNYIGLWTKRRT